MSGIATPWLVLVKTGSPLQTNAHAVRASLLAGPEPRASVSRRARNLPLIDACSCRTPRIPCPPGLILVMCGSTSSPRSRPSRTWTPLSSGASTRSMHELAVRFTVRPGPLPTGRAGWRNHLAQGVHAVQLPVSLVRWHETRTSADKPVTELRRSFRWGPTDAYQEMRAGNTTVHRAYTSGSRKVDGRSVTRGIPMRRSRQGPWPGGVAMPGLSGCRRRVSARTR